MDNPRGHGGEKAFLIIVSLVVGSVFGTMRAFDFSGPSPVLVPGGFLSGTFIVACISLVYTVMAGVVVSICEGMKSIAVQKEV